MKYFGNLCYIERSNDVPAIRDWMLRKNNWMSYQIQNKMITMIGNCVLCQTADEAKQSMYYAVTADSTTDTSGQGQFSISIQYVTSFLQVKNKFLGFYSARDSTSHTLAAVIKDVLLQLGLNLDALKGYCVDGASYISGRLQGVQAILHKKCPEAIYIHCANHSLDLISQEVLKDIKLNADASAFVRETSNIIRESSKRRVLYKSVFRKEGAVRSLLSLCPTRWCERVVAIRRLRTTHKELLSTLTILAYDKSVRNESRAKIAGLLKQAKLARTYFSIIVSEEVFTLCELYAKTMQGGNITSYGVIESISQLRPIRKLQSLRLEKSLMIS